MEQRCEVMLEDILSRKKKLSSKRPFNTIKVLKSNNPNQENKRCTRSSMSTLSMGKPQNFLIEPCSKNTYDSSNKEHNLFANFIISTNNQQEYKSKNAKRRYAYNPDNIKEKTSSRNKSKLETETETASNYKELEMSNKSNIKKNKTKKRKVGHKIFWESKLTGARRVSKRLTNLKMKKQTENNKVNLQNVCKNNQVETAPKSRRLIRMKESCEATNYKRNRNARTGNKTKQQIKYGKPISTKCKRSLSKNNLDKIDASINYVNKNSSSESSNLQLKSALTEVDTKENPEGTDESEGRDMYSFGTSQEVDNKQVSSTSTDINEKMIVSTTMHLDLGNKDNKVVPQGKENNCSILELKTVIGNETEMVLMDDEEMGFVDSAEVIVVALEPAEDEDVQLNQILVENNEKKVENQQCASKSTSVNPNHQELSLSNVTNNQESENINVDINFSTDPKDEVRVTVKEVLAEVVLCNQDSEEININESVELDE